MGFGFSVRRFLESPACRIDVHSTLDIPTSRFFHVADKHAFLMSVEAEPTSPSNKSA
jgi:hypothetical protein